jgi:hypothetical protein
MHYSCFPIIPQQKMDKSHIIEIKKVNFNQQQLNGLLGTSNLVTVPESRPINVASGSEMQNIQLIDYPFDDSSGSGMQNIQLIDYPFDDSSGSELPSSFQLNDSAVDDSSGSELPSSFQLNDFAVDDSSGSELLAYAKYDNRVITPDDWEECLSAIEAGTMRISTAVKILNTYRMKINRLLKKRKTARKNLQAKRGQKPFFNAEEEKIIVEWIETKTEASSQKVDSI